MNLLQQIRNDLTDAIKTKKETSKHAIRIILGEIGRQPKKDLEDNEIIRIIKKLVKDAEECGINYTTSEQLKNKAYIDVLSKYLPEEVSEDEVIKWIKSNIDFSQFRNKMQAMKPIMAHFN